MFNPREYLDLKRQMTAYNEKLTAVLVKQAKLETQFEALKKRISELEKPLEDQKVKMEKEVSQRVKNTIEKAIKEKGGDQSEESESEGLSGSSYSGAEDSV